MIKEATTKLCLDTRGGSDTVGRLIKVRVMFNRRARYYPAKTKTLLTKAEFTAGRSKTAKAAIDDAIPCLHAASEICESLGSAFEWEIFERKYTNWYDQRETVSSTDLFSALMTEYLNTKTLALKTKESYLSALAWLERFSPGTKVKDIDTTFLMKLNVFIRESHAEKNNGAFISENSIRNYFRTYRAIMNYAISTGKYHGDNPVASAYNGTLASTPRQKGSLTEDEFSRFKSYVPRSREEEFSKDFWLALVALSGANIGDLLKLRNRDVHGDYIVYIRTKSRRNGLSINVPMTEYLERFFNRYGTLDPSRPDDYILRFLKGASGENNIKNRIRKVNKRLNTGLKPIFRELGLDLSQAVSYSARHTFSVLAMSSGISHGELQKFLGHASVKTTEVYLRSITTSSIEKDRRFLDDILK